MTGKGARCGNARSWLAGSSTLPMFVERIGASAVLVMNGSGDVYAFKTRMVTMSTSAGPTTKAYHHGNLRSALIEAGMTLLATRTIDDLSLREVARSVGVSATAVYRHFPDKRALMTAMAGEGLARLAAAQRAASEAAGGGAAGFDATGRAYVRFALANPALFRLIFANPAPPDLLSGPAETVPDAMAFLRANAAALAARLPAPGVDPTVLALQAWSVAHGLAMLMLDRQIPTAEATIDAVIDAAFTMGAT